MQRETEKQTRMKAVGDSPKVSVMGFAFGVPICLSGVPSPRRKPQTERAVALSVGINDFTWCQFYYFHFRRKKP